MTKRQLKDLILNRYTHYNPCSAYHANNYYGNFGKKLADCYLTIYISLKEERIALELIQNYHPDKYDDICERVRQQKIKRLFRYVQKIGGIIMKDIDMIIVKKVIE